MKTSRRRTPWRLLRLGSRWLLAIVFLMGGATKVTNLSAFADQLALHSLLPAPVALPLAYFLPWLELACGVCLVLGYAVREAAAILSVLLVTFLAFTFSRPAESDCGCFVFPKVLPMLPWWSTVPRDLLFLACSLILTRRETNVPGDKSLFSPCTCIPTESVVSIKQG